MGSTFEESILFKPKQSKAETKADITDRTARALFNDEAARREAKTARLRQARLDSEAKLAAVEKPAKPAARKKAPARRAKSSS